MGSSRRALAGGVAIALIVVLLELSGVRWGIVEGLSGFFSWIYCGAKGCPLRGAGGCAVEVDIALFWGAVVSAAFSRKLSIKVPTSREAAIAAIAGILMGCGAAVALGDNISGFYSAFINLSLSAPVMWLGMLFGARAGASFLRREYRLGAVRGGVEVSFPKLTTVLGVLVVLGLAVASLVLLKRDPSRAIPFVVAAILGVVVHKSRFCMSDSFKDLFLSGTVFSTGVVVLSLGVGTVLVTFLKYGGTLEEGVGVVSSLWIPALFGGFVFGLGMMLAGGCAVGSMWRAAEGHIKSWIVLLLFGVSNLTFQRLFYSVNIDIPARAVFLPEKLTYLGALGACLAFLVAWWLLATWNQRSKKLVLEF